MFRKMTIVLALAALTACSACNNVTGPMTSDDQVSHVSQNRTELSDPGDGGGSYPGDTQPPAEEKRGPGLGRGDNQHENRTELSDPGSGGGSGDSGDIKPPDVKRGGGTGRGDNEYDEGNGSGERRRSDGTGGR
jgi:hypothetical protein